MKNFKVGCLLFLVSFCLMPSVKAEDCSYKRINTFQEKAAKIKVSYENDIENQFTVFFRNMTKDVYIRDEEGATFFLNQLQTETTMVFNGGYEGGKSYRFFVYPIASDPCHEEKVRTIYVTLPKYNPYSVAAECAGIPEFSLCQKWTNTDGISEETFQQRIKEYKNELKTKYKAQQTKQQTKSIAYYLRIYLLLVGVVIILGGVFVLLMKKIRDDRERSKML